MKGSPFRQVFWPFGDNRRDEMRNRAVPKRGMIINNAQAVRGQARRFSRGMVSARCVSHGPRNISFMVLLRPFYHYNLLGHYYPSRLQVLQKLLVVEQLDDIALCAFLPQAAAVVAAKNGDACQQIISQRGESMRVIVVKSPKILSGLLRVLFRIKKKDG